jgi:hypothetical protein
VIDPIQKWLSLVKVWLLRTPALRPWILAGCLGLASLLALTSIPDERMAPARLLAQTSPLTSETTLPAAGASTLASGSPVSILLVGAVLLGILLVIALVIRRQR